MGKKMFTILFDYLDLIGPLKSDVIESLKNEKSPGIVLEF